MNRVPELLSNTVNTFSLPIAVLLIVLGMVSAIAGKKFFWVATGLNAFVAAYITVNTVMVWPAWQYLLAAVVTGLLAALFTILLKQVSFTLNGFFIFGLLAVAVISLLDFETNSFTPVIIFFVAGSIAACYNLVKPPESQLYITSFIGAFAITCGIFRLLHRPPNALYLAILWVALGIAGSVWQKQQAEKEKQK